MSDQTTQPEPPIGTRGRWNGAVVRRFEDGRWRFEEDFITWYGLTREGEVEVIEDQEPVSSPVVEVPAGEARPVDENDDGRSGDHVTITGVLRTAEDAVSSTARLLRMSDPYDDWFVEGWHLELARPVSPLPTEPGAVIRCRIVGKPGQYIAERFQEDGWLVAGLVNPRGSEEIERVIDVLWPLPARGVSAPGQEPVSRPCACGESADSPEHHAFPGFGSHNFEPVSAGEGAPTDGR